MTSFGANLQQDLSVSPPRRNGLQVDGYSLHVRLVSALIALVTLPALAQQPLIAEQSIAGNARSATPANSTPAATRPQQSTEEAQLPPYLQVNPESDIHSTALDPWEHYNRRVYRFNKRLDNALVKPLALEYVRVVPQPLRNGVGNFFQNLAQPITSVNLLLEGYPASAGKSLGRFAINTTLGVGGVFDPATKMRIPLYNKDFGQTLGRWGWRRSRYFLLPFSGPGTLRDRIGTLTDAQLGPYRYVQPVELRVGLIGLSLVDTRVRILPLDELSAGIDDDYLLVREAWSQRRMHQIDDQTVSNTDAAEDSLKRYDFPEDRQVEPTSTPPPANTDAAPPIKR